MTILRGSRKNGYRTVAPVECPACSHKFAMSGTAAEDKQGPHLVLWPVATKPGDYDEETLNRITRHEGLTVAQTGVQLPAKLRGVTKLPADKMPF